MTEVRYGLVRELDMGRGIRGRVAGKGVVDREVRGSEGLGEAIRN